MKVNVTNHTEIRNFYVNKQRVVKLLLTNFIVMSSDVTKHREYEHILTPVLQEYKKQKKGKPSESEVTENNCKQRTKQMPRVEYRALNITCFNLIDLVHACTG